jgi:hypothetical protein
MGRGGGSPDVADGNGGGSWRSVDGGFPGAEPGQQAWKGGEGRVLAPNRVGRGARRSLTGRACFGGGDHSSGFSARGEKEKGSARVWPLARDGERGNGWVAAFKS